MTTSRDAARTGSRRLGAHHLLLGGLLAVGLAACSDSDDSDPVDTATDPTAEAPTDTDGLDPIDDDTVTPGVDPTEGGDEIDPPGDDVAMPGDGPITIEPPGSSVAENERALFEFLGQRFDRGDDLDVWSCTDSDGESIGFHFGRPDPADPSAETTLSGVGRAYEVAAAGPEDFGIRYEVTSNDEFTMVYETAFVEPEEGGDDTDVDEDDVQEQLLEGLVSTGASFETFEEFQEFVNENGLQEFLGDIESLEEFEQLLAENADEEAGGVEDDSPEPREPVLLDGSLRDELTSVRIGPGRSWSGFSMLGNAAVNCTEIAR